MASAIEAGVLTFDGDGGGAGAGVGAEKEIEALRAEVAAAAGGGDKDSADDARHKLALRLIFASDAAGGAVQVESSLPIV